MPVEKQLLNGTWKLECLSSQEAVLPGDVFEITVPGDVHQTLIDGAVIPDPFWAENFKECDWVSRCDWLIYREFTVDVSLRGKRLELVFDGIDTYAQIRLNGQILGKTNNMFLRYSFDVTNQVSLDGPNRLEVEILSTRNVTEKRDTTGYFACFNSERIFSRRVQCQFGWDWAPDLLSIGIWQEVRLQAVTTGTIEDVYARGDSKGNAFFNVKIDACSAEADGKSSSNLFLELELTDGLEIFRKKVPVCGHNNFVDIKVPNPQLWWPNGYGAPHLYNYTLVLKEGGRLLDRYAGRFGFRTVELIQEPLDDDERSFRFEINGKPVFCMGANWVPAHCFTGCIKEDTYRHLLSLAKNANLNALRVWGGGMYENDIFYDLCDEMGILVWQDFMFACGDIPDDDPKFVDDVIRECKYQVKRLRNHPCIFHWCGGNEKTGAFGKLIKRGDLITRTIIPGIIREYIPTASYTPSSPFSYTDIANDSRSGDTHGGTYEEAFSDDIARFRKHIERKQAVFMSEFGLHGPPVLRSLKKFMPSEYLWPLNGVWESHVQDNPYNSIPETFVQIQQACAEQLFFKPRSVSDFVKTAGTFHAEYLYAEFQHHRRRLPKNSGAMIWMLNDCWPAANWSVIDFYGHPKQAYYALKRACQPVMLSFQEEGTVIELHLTNNSLSTVEGDAALYLQDVNGSVNRLLVRSEVSAGSYASSVILKIDRSEMAPEVQNCYLTAVLETRSGRFQEIFFPDLWKDIIWPEPGLSCQVLSSGRERECYRAVCRITTSKFARCVSLATAEDIRVVLSDNYFDLCPGQSRDIVVTSTEEFNADHLILNHWLTDWEDEPSNRNKQGLELLSKD